jgi:F0F1-type ATP synthase assembly protein I
MCAPCEAASVTVPSRLDIRMKRLGKRLRVRIGSLPLPARIVVIQIVIGAAAAALLSLAGRDASLAALAATLAIAAPNAWFAWRLSRTARAGTQLDVSSQARLALSQGVHRTLLTLLLVVGLVLWLRPEPLAFIGTLLAMHGAYFIAPTLEIQNSR